MKNGLTTSLKKTHTLKITTPEKPSNLMSVDTSGLRMVKSLKCLEASYMLTTEDTTWELPMQELTHYKWDATSSMDTHTIAKKQSSPILVDRTWRIQWDV